MFINPNFELENKFSQVLINIKRMNSMCTYFHVSMYRECVRMCGVCVTEKERERERQR